MPTNHPRINITMDESIVSILTELADKDHTSVASIARELVLEALERREDMALSALAKIRDLKNAKRIKHEDVWK